MITAIQIRATGAIAGTVMLNLLPGEKHMEVGWHLHPDSEGHGYATEAARAVIDRAFRLDVPEVSPSSSRTTSGPNECAGVWA